MSAPLRAAAGRLHGWMRERALPFWCSTGHDGMGRGFVEHLTLDGRPADVAYKRVRVQARQVYVFSHAAVLGWPAGRAAAADGYAFLVREAWLPGGGWARRLGREGGVLDATVDLYDVAFVLLALAWHARATGDAAPIALAHRTLDLVEARMRLGGTPGFADTLPAKANARQQNPHMHLLEAQLALHAATGEARFADGARALVELCRERLFDAASGTLAESYAADWRRLPGARIEPGHQHEWAWLLHRAAAQLGGDAAPAAALFAFAEAHGGDPRTALVRDAVAEDGAVLDAGMRLWPQTEAIKARLVMGADPEAIARGIAALMAGFLTPAGTWVDHRGPDGVPRGDRIPASSLYHLFAADAELRRVLG